MVLCNFVHRTIHFLVMRGTNPAGAFLLMGQSEAVACHSAAALTGVSEMKAKPRQGATPPWTPKDGGFLPPLKWPFRAPAKRLPGPLVRLRRGGPCYARRRVAPWASVADGHPGHGPGGIRGKKSAGRVDKFCLF